MKIISKDDIIHIPARIAVCPICGAEVVIDYIDEWEEDEELIYNGRPLLRASELGVKVNCIKEPSMDSSEWRDWFNGHWSTPYIDWLTVEKKVYDWIDGNFRFENLLDIPTGVTESNVKTFWIDRPDLGNKVNT
jgi:hypothetical protein